AEVPASPPSTRLSGRHFLRMERGAKLLLAAAHEAWNQSGWEPDGPLPVVLGTTSGGMSLGEAYYRQANQTPHLRRHQPTRVVHYQAQQQGLDLGDAFGFNGPVVIIANACASSANAIGHA